MRAAFLALIALVGAVTSGCRDEACDWYCVNTSDGGCEYHRPSCTSHCGGPFCSPGSALQPELPQACVPGMSSAVCE